MGRATEYEFLFVVEGISMDDDQTTGILADRFDAVLSWNRGQYRIAVSGSGTSALDAAAHVVSRLTAAVPGLRVIRLDPELVGIPDISQRTGHSRQNVLQWVNGERNASRRFPGPEGCAGRSLVWRWADVNEWLLPLGLDDGAVRPSRPDAARIDVMLAESRDARATETPVPLAVLRGRCVSGCEVPVFLAAGGFSHLR